MDKKQDIAKKKQRLHELTVLVKSLPKQVSRNQKQSIDNLFFKEEFRLNELLDECKDRELDIKIKTAEDILAIYKK